MSDKGRSEEGRGDEDKFKSGCGGEEKKRGYKRKIRKAKHAVLFQFREVKRRLYRNQHHHPKNNKDTNASSSGGAAATAAPTNPGKSSRNTSSSRESCCCLCYVRKPLTLDSPAAAVSPSSQTSDPNFPSFSYEYSKALIENNDFYSKECNVYIDLDDDVSNKVSE